MSLNKKSLLTIIFGVILCLSMTNLVYSMEELYTSAPGSEIIIPNYDSPGYTVTNTGPDTYLIPAKSREEFDAFRTAVPGLPGLSICKVIDGGWSAWSDWSKCTADCGGGTQSRSRTCDSPAPSCNGADCSGNPTSTQACNTQPCTLFSVSRNGGYGSCVVNNAYTNSYHYPTTSSGGFYRYEWSISSVARYHFTDMKIYIYRNGGLITIQKLPRGCGCGGCWCYYRAHSGTVTGSTTFWINPGDVIQHRVRFSSRGGYECQPVHLNHFWARLVYAG